jgi:hypothetical protein
MTLQKQDVDPTLELLAIFCMPQLSQGPISHNQHLCYLNSLANGAKPIIKQQSIYCAISGEPPISVWSLMATLANTLCKDDADTVWRGNLITKRSTTGYIFKVYGGTIAWKS